jgi:glutamyl-tRNA synthetase
MTQKKTIKTRFAPSPTGYLHLGGARTALFNWLFARHNQGTFVLRIEDTDQVRSTGESTEAILDSLKWLRLDWDEGPYFQSQRLDFYRDLAARLVREGAAYYCECSLDDLEEKRKQALALGKNPVYDGTCRDKGLGPGPGRVIRFRSPHSGVRLDDLVRGTIEFAAPEEPDDFILFRSDGFPTYNFAAVADDMAMGITHVIRGDDHVTNTPRQIHLYRALGVEPPLFAHVPMILGADKTRLSKRHGAVSVTAYRDLGILPEAMVNYLARLGWSHGDQEVFSRDELIRYFSLEAVGRSSAVFDPDKLVWLNYQYIKGGDPRRLLEETQPFWRKAGIRAGDDEALALQVVQDLQPRAKTLAEMAEAGAFYFSDEVVYDQEAARKHLTPETLPFLSAIAERLPLLEAYSRESLDAFLRSFAKDNGISLKVISQPLRVALTGRTASPGLDQVMFTLGRERVIRRLEQAVHHRQG